MTCCRLHQASHGTYKSSYNRHAQLVHQTCQNQRAAIVSLCRTLSAVSSYMKALLRTPSLSLHKHHQHTSTPQKLTSKHPPKHCFFKANHHNQTVTSRIPAAFSQRCTYQVPSTTSNPQPAPQDASSPQPSPRSWPDPFRPCCRVCWTSSAVATPPSAGSPGWPGWKDCWVSRGDRAVLKWPWWQLYNAGDMKKSR